MLPFKMTTSKNYLLEIYSFNFTHHAFYIEKFYKMWKETVQRKCKKDSREAERKRDKDTFWVIILEILI